MKCKVLAHKLGYKGTTYSTGDTVEMSDTDPCTNVLIRIGRVEPIKETKKPKKKTGKKASKKTTYKDRAMTVEKTVDDSQ